MNYVALDVDDIDSDCGPFDGGEPSTQPCAIQPKAAVPTHVQEAIRTLLRWAGDDCRATIKIRIRDNQDQKVFSGR